MTTVVLKGSEFAARLAAGDNPAAIFGGHKARLAGRSRDRLCDFDGGVKRDGLTIAPAAGRSEGVQEKPRGALGSR